MPKKHGLLLALGFTLVLILGGCSSLQNDKIPVTVLPQSISEDAPIIPNDMPTTLSNQVTLKWKQTTHASIAEIAARSWGLSTGRIANIANASKLPDDYQSGLDNGFNQQWSHAYLYTSLGFWVWGDADDDFYDNINQDGGEMESPEGYNGKSAKYYYQLGDQNNGDWYLGYASHYIEDVCLILHASDPSIDMLTQHFNFEAWVANNWTTGHNFVNVVVNDTYYYAVTDLKETIRNAAKGCSYWTSSLGTTVWDNYASSGYPTGAGTGNAILVSNTKTMLIRAVRYTRGTIKYTLDSYGQWTNKY